MEQIVNRLENLSATSEHLKVEIMGSSMLLGGNKKREKGGEKKKERD